MNELNSDNVKFVQGGASGGAVTSVNKQQIDAVTFTGYTKGDVKIGASIGFTITLGNFSSKNINVWMERYTDAGNEEQTFNEIIRWIERKIDEKNEELRAMGKQMIALEIPTVLTEQKPQQ